MDVRELKDKASQLFTKGKFAKAAEAYEQLCKADPKDHQARLRMGDAWAKAGQKERAASAYVAAAEGFAKEGFLPRAIAASKLVLELDPSHKGVQQMLADLYARKTGAGRSTAPKDAPAAPAPKKTEPIAIEDEASPPPPPAPEVAPPAPPPPPAATVAVEIEAPPAPAVELELDLPPPPGAPAPPEVAAEIELELGATERVVTGEIEVPIVEGAVPPPSAPPPPPAPPEEPAPPPLAALQLEIVPEIVLEQPKPPEPPALVVEDLPAEPVLLSTPKAPLFLEIVEGSDAEPPSEEILIEGAGTLDDVEPPPPAPAPAVVPPPPPPVTAPPAPRPPPPAPVEPPPAPAAAGSQPPASRPSQPRIWLPTAFTPPAPAPAAAPPSAGPAPAPMPAASPSRGSVKSDLERSLEAFSLMDAEAPPEAEAAPPAPAAEPAPEIAVPPAAAAAAAAADAAAAAAAKVQSSFTELELEMEAESMFHAVEAAAFPGSSASVQVSAEEAMEADEAKPAEQGALPKIPLFSDLPEDAFIALFEECPLRRFDAGQRIIQQGSVGVSFFVICAGKVRVRREDHGAVRELATLDEGAFFGEMALLSDAPRTASVDADADDTQLLEISGKVLARLSRKHPTVAQALKKFYRQRLLSNVMNTAPLFKPFGIQTRRELVQRFRARDVGPGEVLLAEGKPTDGLYVVLAGEVAVRVGDREVATLKEGELFGEMSLLNRAPAMATVVSAKRTSLLRLPREDFDRVIMSHPQILSMIAELNEARRRDNAQRAPDSLV